LRDAPFTVMAAAVVIDLKAAFGPLFFVVNGM